MVEYILKEGVLNDDTLFIADDGKVFKGGYIALVVVWTYATAWSNNKTVKRFRKQEKLDKFLKKNYPNFEYDY
jgi:hypothetical protein